MTESTRAMKILWVCTGHILEPRSGGELRIHHLTRELARRGHQVDVLSFVVRNHPAREGQPLQGLTIRESHSPWLDAAAVADRLRLVPITELPLWLRPMCDWLRRWIEQQGGYDIIEFDFPWFSRLYPAARSAHVVFGSHNIESDWWASRPMGYPLGRMFLQRLRRHELRAASQAKGVTACTKADGDWFIANGGLDPKKICVVPNGYDPEQVGRPDAAARRRVREKSGIGEHEKIALFIGSDQPPNRRAVKDLLQMVLPRLTSETVRLAIVGRVGERFGDIRDERVLIAGEVESVLPWLQAADVGLNPVCEGSGSNVKLAEYAAAGLPIVTTPFGLRGYETLGEWLNVREIEDFAEAIGQAQWPSAIPEAKIQTFSWPSIAGALEGFYRQLGAE